MRIYLKLSKNNKVLPFSYQELLTGVIHKWIGSNNEIHGKTSQYSFSWIQNTTSTRSGVNLSEESYFFVSSVDELLIKRIVKGVLADPLMFNGVKVNDVQIKNVPEFSFKEEFLMGSPVLLKIKDENRVRHITLEDTEFDEVLTESFKNKLLKADINPDGVSVKLNPDKSFRQTKLVTYKGIKNKASFAPVIISGTPEQIAFAWCNGLGNSTGIGFGSLK